MNDPLVSIITPSYNQGEFIEQTLRSVRNQDYARIEHIVMDGGSTDGTLEVLGRYEDTYDLRWYSQPDEGPADACVSGFERASGDIFAYINSDDFYLPGAISTVVEEFRSRPKTDLVYGNGYRIDEHNRVLEKIYSTYAASFLPAEWMVYDGMMILQPAAFWRRDAYEAVGGFNPDNKTVWDQEFWADLAVNGASFSWLNEFLCCFRVHSDSIGQSGDWNEIWRKETRELFEKVMNRSPVTSDRTGWSLVSRAISRLSTPQRFFRTWNLPGEPIDPEAG